MEEKNLKELDITLFKAFNMLSDDVSSGFKSVGDALGVVDRFMHNQRRINRKTSFYHMVIFGGAIAGGYHIYKKFEEIDRELKELRNKGE